MGLQRSLCDKFPRVKQEGRGRYLELERQAKDMRGRGPLDRQPRSPAFEGVQLYEPAASKGERKGAWGRGARRKVCCKEDICPPLRHEAVTA
jgi:hypothetical protein